MRAAASIAAAVSLFTSLAQGGDIGTAVARHPSGAIISRMEDGTIAVPLIGERPEWYTPEVRARTIEASGRGLAYDFQTRSAVAPAPSEVLLRPGTRIFPDSLLGSWCTAGFVFDGGTPITRISTAGHCTAVGEIVLALAAPSLLTAIGKTSFSTGKDQNDLVGNDWALIDINDTWRPHTDPTVALVGGPCGKAVPLDQLVLPLVKYVGHALGIGTGGTPRGGVLDVGRSSDAFAAIGPAYGGDSGAPVLETLQLGGIDSPCAAGGAVGLLTHVSTVDTGMDDPAIPTGFFFGTPIQRITEAGHSLVDATLPISAP